MATSPPPPDVPIPTSPSPAILGQAGDPALSPSQPSAALAGPGVGTSPLGQSPLTILGADLPPLSGGTSFGAEFVGVPRTRWQSRSQFILVLTGYCIGVGNLWRFPYLCGKYGGGAFLVAYGVMLFSCAAPLFFYETVLGQKFQRGPAETFRKMAPRWTGLAYIPVAMTLFYLPYYQLIVTYALHYFLVSFGSPLPWVDGTTPEAYLDDVVLQKSATLMSEDSWTVNGRLLIEVFAVYVITVLCLVKGIHSAGKAAYVTVILPVIMLFILFCVCIQLDGASDGLRYYLVPRWEALLDMKLWGLAAGQIIFSLSPGTGTCISLASFHDQKYRGLFVDCALVAFCNSAFSLFGGVVVFSVVGNLAKIQGRAVEEVAASGEGLAFIVFAQGLAEFGKGVWSSIFAVLFFLTLFLLGLDSTFAVVETLQTYANDFILARDPTTKISFKGNVLRLITIAVVLLLFGMPYVTKGGFYLLEIADHYIVTYCLVTSVLLEYIMIGYVYTAEQMLEDVYVSTGVRLPRAAVWQIRYVAPSILTFVLVLLLVAELNEGGPGNYPTWAVFSFGVWPVAISLMTFIIPLIQFRVRRFFWGNLYPLLTRWTPEGLSAARDRAKGSGFQGFHESASTGASSDVALSRA